jgi:ABC-2 type transport system ATP-binding protein
MWIRRFMHALAAEGRTVLVSSHLLSEMAQTADHLIVIGRGRLIADTSVKDFVDRASESVVVVRSPSAGELRSALTERGYTVREEDGALLVPNVGIAEVGELAASRSLVLHELSSRNASLEDAFMKLTGGHVEFHGTGTDDVMKGGL